MPLRLTHRFHVVTVNGSEASDEEMKKEKREEHLCVCAYLYRVSMCEFVCGYKFRLHEAERRVLHSP